LQKSVRVLSAEMFCCAEIENAFATKLFSDVVTEVSVVHSAVTVSLKKNPGAKGYQDHYAIL
jgi:hypothetical protein